MGLVLLTLGCRHTDPFTNPSQTSDQPFDPTPPARLTLNAGSDRGAAWLPDGSGILYGGHVASARLPPSSPVWPSPRWITYGPPRLARLGVELLF